MAMSARDILDRVAELKSAGEAFVLATVVRTVAVTAAKAGAKAVIRGRPSAGSTRARMKWARGPLAASRVVSTARR